MGSEPIEMPDIDIWKDERNTSDFTKVIVHSGIKSISDGAFEGMEYITEVDMTEAIDLEIIEDKAFYGCESLKEVKLGNNIKYIGEQAFKNCTSLKTINIPSEITIDKQAFYGCSSLNSILSFKQNAVVEDDAFTGTHVSMVFEEVYTLKFNINEGIGGPEDCKISTWDNESLVIGTIPEEIPTKEGYEFDGWYFDGKDGTKYYKPGEEISISKSDLTDNTINLYCKWNEKSDTLTENDNTSSKEQDTTTADKVLSKAGKSKIIVVAIMLLVITSIITIIKYRKIDM